MAASKTRRTIVVGGGLAGLMTTIKLCEAGVPVLLVNGSVTQLGYAIHQAGAAATEQVYDIAIAIACNIMRSLCGEKWNPTEVLLSHRPPQDLTPYQNFFRAALRFNANLSAVTFPTRWLDHRIPSADPLLHRHLEQQAAGLHQLRKADTLSELRRL